MEAIKSIDLSYVYPDGTKALNGVDLVINKGDCDVILGPNGAGKSTLFYHFNGLLMPSKGKVFVLGNEVTKSNLDMIRQKVGLVFQDPDDQLFAPTVGQDIAFGPTNLDLPIKEIQERVKWALDVVGLKGFEDRPPHHLSEGEKKRAAIAGILAMKTEILVMDEPTSRLDPLGASRIMSFISNLKDELGITVIMATHDVEMVPLYADHVHVMDKGRIILGGTPQEVFSEVKTIRNTSLRLPRITHLFEILEKRDHLPINNPLPLTIGEARKEVLKLLADSRSK